MSSPGTSLRCTLALALALAACGPGRPSLSLPGDPEETGDDASTSVPDLPGTEGESETGSTDDTTTFVPDYDQPITEHCSLFEQDCPDGEKCVTYASNGRYYDGHKCVPVLGDQAPGEPCIYAGKLEATDDCDETSACFEVQEIDGQLVGVCRAFCTGTADSPECPPGSQCLIDGEATFAFCIPSCDPIAQDCDPGLACYWAYNDFNCVFTTRDIPPGQPCGFINDCAAGLSCTPADFLPDCQAASACCAPFCDLAQPVGYCDPLPETTCVPFFEAGTAPPGYENIGLCLLPP